MTSLSITDARADLPAVVQQAASEAVTLMRHGKPVAVVLSPGRYDELIEVEDELLDIEAFDDAVAEANPRIPWDQVKLDLGWL